MKRKLTHIAGIIVLAIGSIASSAFAQTTANGPYYATPSWDQKLDAATRFIVLANWNSEAVLDRETGLVWQRSPATDGLDWTSASQRCMRATTGERSGWRLPTINELGSLILRSGNTVPPLPPGHPFTGLTSTNPTQTNSFWSTTPTKPKFINVDSAHLAVGWFIP